MGNFVGAQGKRQLRVQCISLRSRVSQAPHLGRRALLRVLTFMAGTLHSHCIDFMASLLALRQCAPGIAVAQAFRCYSYCAAWSLSFAFANAMASRHSRLSAARRIAACLRPASAISMSFTTTVHLNTRSPVTTAHIAHTVAPQNASLRLRLQPFPCGGRCDSGGRLGVSCLMFIASPFESCHPQPNRAETSRKILPIRSAGRSALADAPARLSGAGVRFSSARCSR